MDVALSIIAFVMGLIGLIGVIVPVIPGTLLSYAGLVCIYFASGTSVTVTQLIVFGVLSAITMILDYLLPGYFSKMFGGTKYGIWGATVGTIIGVFFGVAGIIFGPFVGAVAGEVLGAKNELSKAVKVGFGSMLAFFAGSGLKLVIGVYLFICILKSIITMLF